MEKIKIPTHLFTYFEQAGHAKEYHKDEFIYMQGDEAKHLYLITKGRVRIYYMDKEGNEITLEIIDKGRIFGESSFLQQSSRPVSVQAINDVSILYCTLENMYPYLMKSKELTISLFQLMSNTADHLTSLLHHFYLYDRYEKIAAFLIEQTAYPNIEKGITHTCIPYSHEEIALYVGLNRVTVTKCLKQFSDQHMIHLGYKKITIINRDALMACLPDGAL